MFSRFEVNLARRPDWWLGPNSVLISQMSCLEKGMLPIKAELMFGENSKNRRHTCIPFVRSQSDRQNIQDGSFYMEQNIGFFCLGQKATIQTFGRHLGHELHRQKSLFNRFQNVEIRPAFEEFFLKLLTFNIVLAA